jgi:predicted Rossmann fold nucleotide-binding protein DprA/Smf involved in DNA uptake
MILAIVGSRHFTNFDLLEQCINQMIQGTDQKITKIISGGAKGADHLAEKFAKKYGIEIIVHHADWEKYGKSAGPKRNTLIVDSCDVLVAFPSKDSRGTWDSVTKAKRVGKKVYIFHV